MVWEVWESHLQLNMLPRPSPASKRVQSSKCADMCRQELATEPAYWAAVRFQTEFGVTKEPKRFEAKTDGEGGWFFLQNCRSSSPWSFWHILAHFGTIAPHHPHPIKSVGLKFGKALPLPGKAGGLAAELAVGILELKDVSAQTWPCRRL